MSVTMMTLRFKPAQMQMQTGLINSQKAYADKDKLMQNVEGAGQPMNWLFPRLI